MPLYPVVPAPLFKVTEIRVFISCIARPAFRLVFFRRKLISPPVFTSKKVLEPQDIEKVDKKERGADGVTPDVERF